MSHVSLSVCVYTSLCLCMCVVSSVSPFLCVSVRVIPMTSYETLNFLTVVYFKWMILSDELQ